MMKNFGILIVNITYFVFLYFMGKLLFKEMVILHFDTYLPSFIEVHGGRFLLIFLLLFCMSFYYIMSGEKDPKPIRRYVMIGGIMIGILLLSGALCMIIYVIMNNFFDIKFIEFIIFSKTIVLHKTHFIYGSFYQNLMAIVMSITLFPPLWMGLGYEPFERGSKLI